MFLWVVETHLNSSTKLLIVPRDNLGAESVLICLSSVGIMQRNLTREFHLTWLLLFPCLFFQSILLNSFPLPDYNQCLNQLVMAIQLPFAL